MEKYFKQSILDELYEQKSDKFAQKITEEMGKYGQREKSILNEEQLTNKIKGVVANEKAQKEVLKMLNNYEMSVGNELDFWNKMYYKLGVYDCAEMKKIIQSGTEDKEECMCFDEYSDDFLDYLETNRMKILKENTEYKEITKKIEQIKENNPNVRTFLEDKESIELTKTELNAILDILELQGDLDNAELKATFKLGAKEMVQFFRQMRLL